jgi:hypothetical protein
MLRRWIERFVVAEALNALAQAIGLGNPIGMLVVLIFSCGALAVGWWTAAQASAEGIIRDWGTLGYVGVILGIALSLSMVFLLISVAVNKWRGPSITTMPPQQVQRDQQLEIVHDVHFVSGHTAMIDGKHFVKCDFENCALKYEGGRFQLTECRIKGTLALGSQNAAVVNTLIFLKTFRLLNLEMAVLPLNPPTTQR